MDLSRFAINRITVSELNFDDFIRFVYESGINKIELRNDIPGEGIIDSLPPGSARRLLDKYGIKVLTINALSGFDVLEKLKENYSRLERLTELAASIGCGAIVMCPYNMCPNNQKSDIHSNGSWESALTALEKYSPLLENSGVMGFIEPLGFPTSSIRSMLQAQEIIEKSGSNMYRLVFDTFHFYLGTDTIDTIRSRFKTSLIGIVHVSSIRKSLKNRNNLYKDEERILPGSDDLLRTREQLDLLENLGYNGDISLEIFSKDVRELPVEVLKANILNSIQYINIV